MESTHEYIGDGVYVEFDGISFNLRLGDHRNKIAIVLEPEVFENLRAFVERCYAAIARGEKDESE